jgi:osmotically-inducible protein OsmY
MATDVLDALKRCLQASPYLQLRTIDCDCRDGVVTLRGRVTSFFLKQMAQTLAGGVVGMERISNQIEVASRGGREHSVRSVQNGAA